MRSAGDAPNIGRVARVPGTGLRHKGERRQRRRGERSGDRGGGSNRQRIHRRHVIIAWSSVLGLLALLVLGFFLWSWISGRMSRQVAASDGPLLQRHVASKFASPTEEEALEIVRLGLAARDEDAVLRWFRPGGAQPQEMVAFLTNLETLDGPVTGYQWLSSVDANGLLLDGVLVHSAKGGKLRNRLALLTPDEQGVWQIDFEALARTVRPSWQQMLADDGGAGVVRVMLARDSYYNGPFKNDHEWVCFGMASPDVEEILLGYALKDSPQARAIERMLPEGDDPIVRDASRKAIVRATLELKRPPGAEMRQFEIIQVLAEDWVLSAVPFDAR